MLLLPVKSKYSLWYPVLTLPEFMFFAQCERLQVLHSYVPVAKIMDLCNLMLHVILTLVKLLYLLEFGQGKTLEFVSTVEQWD